MGPSIKSSQTKLLGKERFDTRSQFFTEVKDNSTEIIFLSSYITYYVLFLCSSNLQHFIVAF